MVYGIFRTMRIFGDFWECQRIISPIFRRTLKIFEILTMVVFIVCTTIEIGKNHKIIGVEKLNFLSGWNMPYLLSIDRYIRIKVLSDR